MAVTRRQSAVGAGDPPVATFASTPVEGNLLVAISCHRSGSSETCTIDGTGWTEHIERSVLPLDASHRRGLAVYSKVAGAAEATTVSTVWATAEPGHRLLIQEFQGDASEVFAFLEAVSNDNGATNSGSGGNVSTGTTSSLTAQAMLLISCLGARDGATPTMAGTHWTNALDEIFSSGGSNGLATGSGYWEESTSGTKSDAFFHDSGNDTGLTAGLLVFSTAAAGGTAHTQDVNDTVGATDARAFGRGLAVADTASIADARAFQRGLVIADAPSVADARVLSIGRQITVADGVAAADEVTTAKGKGVTIEDVVFLVDARAFQRGLVLADTAALVDVLAFEREIHLADTVAAADSASTIRSVFLSIADAVSIADARSFLSTFFRTIVDAVGLTDAQVFGGTAEQGEEQDLTLALVTKAPLSLGQGGSGGLELGAGSQGSLVLVMEGHRYWRLLIDAIQSSTTRGDIWEIELHETEGGADATTPSLTTTASDGAFSSGNVFDNDTGTFWGPTPAVAAWVQVDVGAGQTIAVAEWTLHHGFADFMPVDVRLQWSDDAVTWHTHDTRTDLVWTPPETQTFTLVAARDPLVKSSLSSSSGTKGTLTLAD